MRITEAARHAGTSPRMLRYYEAEGLLAPARCDNGYRDYGAGEVLVARQIVALSHAGFPVSLISDVEEQIDALASGAEVIRSFLDNLQDVVSA